MIVNNGFLWLATVNPVPTAIRDHEVKFFSVWKFISNWYVQQNFCWKITLLQFVLERQSQFSYSNFVSSRTFKSVLKIFFNISIEISFFIQNDGSYSRAISTTVLHFRRRQSSSPYSNLRGISIILRPSIFRTNFRPSSIQPRDYTKKNRTKSLERKILRSEINTNLFVFSVRGAHRSDNQSVRFVFNAD